MSAWDDKADMEAREYYAEIAQEKAVKEAKKEAIADFIKKLRERCEDHKVYAEGRLVNRHNPEDAWGETYSANDLLKYAEELKLKIDKGE